LGGGGAEHRDRLAGGGGVASLRQPAEGERESPERPQAHLRHEQPWLFTFLRCPGLDATNNAAEREMRPAVIMRKTWGGNRTRDGAEAQKMS